MSQAIESQSLLSNRQLGLPAILPLKHREPLGELKFDEEASKFNSPNFLIPHTIFIKPGGEIGFRHNGLITESELLEKVLEVMTPYYQPAKWFRRQARISRHT